jgi:sarcosine oxidase, subunit gamma
MIAKESPLRGMNKGNIATVSFRELPGLHTIDLRVAPDTPAHSAVVEALGMHLPKPGKSSSQSLTDKDDTHALCLGPDCWLIVGDVKNETNFSFLKNDHHFSTVDVSGQRTTIELEGHHAKDVLAHLWEQDLREKNFPVASVSQGLMAKAPVIVWHIAPLRYRIMVRSSFALHLWKALIDAAEEWM